MSRLFAWLALLGLVAAVAIGAQAEEKTDATGQYYQDVGRGVRLYSDDPIEFVIVDTKDGALRGTRVNNTDYFLGIPFAKPPVDDLRWRAPQPVQRWSGVRDANLYAPDCTSSKSNYIYLGNTSEDCLYLNVFRRSTDYSKEKLPVMAWLYGGSWEYGGSSFIVYDGAAMADIGNVIIVTINYRLGAFGYAAAPALQKEDKHNSTGNYGTQDQRAALQWIQDNIANFGGDPKNVTLFGQSAGGASTSNHVVMPRSNGLFDKVVIESGPPSAWTYKTLNQSSSHFSRIASAVGCAAKTSEEEVACMRGVNTTEIWRHQENDPSVQIDWGPTIDGVELTDATWKLWKEGKVNNVSAMMIGTVKDEGSLFVEHIKPKATEQDLQTWISTTFTGNLSDTIRKLYSASQYDTPFLAASAILSDAEMTCNARRASREMTNRGVPSFLYSFTHLPFVVKLAEPGYGVMHSSEVPFVFRSRLLLLGKGEVELANKVVRYWTNFAWSGDPNIGQDMKPTPGAVPWPQFSPQYNTYLNLNMTITPQQNFTSNAKCDFWDKVYASGCSLSHLPVPCDF
ncbi:hypothetical protein PTSG_12925 [Salpingoeca rosetta]|uniref:Carboxylic ester hydrolase n=1 Tax=Salpingoeca rosetta (strain ATCC 50818 / BSB-021) TaxID=946362 RepID=F2UP38_SALR5|nr:uncharacterized protein PTSG_12925 [Salpingoeca rosetta]EGD79393.1 hypothetical protein PTSG_12925 [Salpingoeca rosetta]|eukprot:XP_004989162.1 hypothetical protein PTSG_12925 [Salpingoeca rosetta]